MLEWEVTRPEPGRQRANVRHRGYDLAVFQFGSGVCRWEVGLEWRIVAHGDGATMEEAQQAAEAAANAQPGEGDLGEWTERRKIWAESHRASVTYRGLSLVVARQAANDYEWRVLSHGIDVTGGVTTTMESGQIAAMDAVDQMLDGVADVRA